LAEQCLQLLMQFALAALNGVLHQDAAFLQLQADGNARLMFFLQLMAKAGIAINPGLNAKHIAPHFGHREFCAPAVIAQKLHRRCRPVRGTGQTPVQHDCQPVVTVDKHFTAHIDLLPRSSLDRELTVFEHRGRGFNSNTRQ